MKNKIYLFLILSLSLVMSSPGFVQAKEEISIKLYFHKPAEKSCEETQEVTRQVPMTPKVADLALKLLFKGPEEAEKKLGVSNPYLPKDNYPKPDAEPLAKSYLGVSIKDGVAIVNFKPKGMDYLESALCAQDSVKTPIEKTLLQFPTIKEVKYAIDGKVVEAFDI